jgi:hypothetical protein
MTESNNENKFRDQIPETSTENKSTDDQKKEEYEAVKLQVKRLLFGVSCADCIAKRQRKE